MTLKAPKPIGDLLLELVQPKKTHASRFGVGAVLILIFAAIALTVFVWRIVSDETRRNELESLYVAGENISISAEERLTNISVRLSSVAGIGPGFSCRRLKPLFHTYPELVEFSIVDADRRVLKSCANPSAMGELSHPTGSVITNPSTLLAKEHARASNSAIYSPPYLDNGPAGPFSDLVLLPSHNDLSIVARISLPVTLRFASADKLNRFQHYYLLDVKTVFATTVIHKDLPSLEAMEVCLPLPPLPSRVELGLTSSLLSSFYSNSLYAWCALVMLGLIFVSLFLLWRFQTQQLKAASAMRARILVQRAVSESLLDALCVIDSKGKILYSNDAFGELFGYGQKETTGLMPPYPFWPKDDTSVREAFSLALAGAGERHKKQYFEFEAVRKDLTHFECAVQVFPLFAGDGKRLGYMVTHSNITQANRSARELRAMQQRFTRVLETMDAAVSVISLQGSKPTLLFANTIYQDQFGDSPDQHIKFCSLLHEVSANADDIYDKERNRWYAIHVKNITWIDESEAQLLSAYDVTAAHINRETVARQMEKAERSSKLINMGEMASSLAHELNQPLAALQNYAVASKVMLENKRLSPEEAIRMFEKIIAQTQRATQVMRRIRSFAKRTNPIRAPANVVTIVNEAVEMARPLAKEHGVAVQTRLEPGMPTVVCDAILIGLVLINLIKNAIEASEHTEKKCVQVDVHHWGNSLRFEVIDFGEGISPKKKDSLYQPFYTTKETGMGIGLNLCRSIVESHNGHLAFRDNPEGGTIFYFDLSLAR